MPKKDMRGRPSSGIRKKAASVFLSEESWILLEHQAQEAGMNRSVYVDMLIKRPNNNFLEDFRQLFLAELEAAKRQRVENSERIERLENLLKKLGMTL